MRHSKYLSEGENKWLQSSREQDNTVEGNKVGES